MKKMGEQEGFTVLSLEGRMYLFLPKAGTDRVIISAHGGRSKTTKDFRVPSDAVLRFYSEDTNVVLDPGFDSFYAKEAAPKEIVYESETCFNYELSKYQGSHNTQGETYQSIAKTINRVAKTKDTLLTQAGKQTDAGKKSRLLTGAAREKLAAVLTIRNRVLRGDVNLAYAIDQVKAAAPQIVIFDCLFCRWLAGGGKDSVNLVNRF
jgi:hypothetical protein